MVLGGFPFRENEKKGLIDVKHPKQLKEDESTREVLKIFRKSTQSVSGQSAKLAEVMNEETNEENQEILRFMII